MKANYIAQLLISKNHHGINDSLISISQINENYLNWIDKIINGYKNEITKYQELAMLKLAYITIMGKLKGKKSVDDKTEFDKTELKEQSIESSNEAKRKYLDEKHKKEENPRKMNEYKELNVLPRTDIKIIRSQYLKELKGWVEELDKNIEKEKYDPKIAQKEEAILLAKADAFDSLSDPEYKMKLDEILLFNFCPNQEKNYIPNNMSEVTYLPETPSEHIDPITQRRFYALNGVKFGSIKSGDDCEVIATHIGNIGIGRFRKSSGENTYQDTRLLKEYRILKKYQNPQISELRKKATQKDGAVSIWDDELNGEVFRISGNLHENILMDPNVDKTFVQYTKEVLLSTTNLEESIEHNGGYIGEVCLSKNGEEYTVRHDNDSLCAAKEFQKVTKIAPVDNKIIIYKIDQGKLETYIKDLSNGKLIKLTTYMPISRPKRKKDSLDFGVK